MSDLLWRLPATTVYPPDIVQRIGYAYVEWAAKFGLRCDVLWAQMLLETAGLRFGGEVKPQQYNLCGLRKVDASGYFSFRTPEAGALAHVAHLGCHALPACPKGWMAECLSDPKHSPMGHWHDMATVADLETGERPWCPTPGYASAVCRVWNEGV